MSKGLFFLSFLLLLFVTPILTAQEQELVINDLWGTGKYLNAEIATDTAKAPWQYGMRVYILKKGGIYPWNAQFNVQAGRTFKMRAETGGTGRNPIILLYDAAGSDRPPGNMVSLSGAQAAIEFKNLTISGYDEEDRTQLDGIQGGLITVPAASTGVNIYVDGCILSSTNGNHIRTDGKPVTVRVTNTIFADMGFNGRSNFGAGKGLDLRDQDIDTVHIENCTFVNSQDRIIRHYQSNKGPIRNLIFNHNTIVNAMSYHGLLSLGRVDSTGNGKLEIKNNLLIDPFALGADTAFIRQGEFGDPGELDPHNNLPRMAWILANPNSAAKWDISNNYYTVSDSGQAMLNLPLPMGPYYRNEGPPLTWGINRRLNALGKDTNATFKKIRIHPENIPPLMTTMIRWVYTPRDQEGCDKTKGGNNDPNFVKISDGNWKYDFNRRTVWYYSDTLNCDFWASEQPVSSDAKVVGDTRWSFLGTLVGVDDINMLPTNFALSQNYPNPFNPNTSIAYELPKSGFISVKVYDLLGREVAALVNEFKQAGSYQITWKADNLGSGVYFYKMQAGSFTSTKKMILMK
jgi:hypothetical protein